MSDETMMVVCDDAGWSRTLLGCERLPHELGGRGFGEKPLGKLRRHHGYQHVVLWLLYFVEHERRRRVVIPLGPLGYGMAWHIQNPVLITLQYP